MPEQGKGERLQKILANAGIGSRRQVEDMIRAGRIRLNGQPARLGDKAVAGDSIELDGKPVAERRLAAVERLAIVYNKPEGEIVTRRDPEGRPCVFDRLPRLERGRWIAVGRLDINSAGLLLLTTDGELANRLMHPRYQIDREYAVRVLGEVTPDMVSRLVTGVTLEDGEARFEDVVDSGGEGANRWFHVVIMEGRKREVRRLWEAVGARVSRLKRVRYGPVILDSKVKVGQWRELTREEQRAVLGAVDLEQDSPWGTLELPGSRVYRARPGPRPAARTRSAPKPGSGSGGKAGSRAGRDKSGGGPFTGGRNPGGVWKKRR